MWRKEKIMSREKPLKEEIRKHLNEDSAKAVERFHHFLWQESIRNFDGASLDLAIAVDKAVRAESAAETAALKARAEKAEACQSAWRKWAIETVGRRGQIHCGQGIFDLAHMALINGMLNDADKAEAIVACVKRVRDGWNHVVEEGDRQEDDECIMEFVEHLDAALSSKESQ
jgi:hypothetical protein